MATLFKNTHTARVHARPQIPGTMVNSDERTSVAGDGFHIVPFRDGARSSHALVASPGICVRVNGSVVLGGLRVLRHKDELLVGSRRMYFSAETVPVVHAFQTDGSRLPRCVVCRGEIQDGAAAVRCPGCSRLYHQIDAVGDSQGQKCWTYSATCRFCEHPTSLSGEPSWRPDDDDVEAFPIPEKRG
jgi:hypothetical protein